ncbi:MAG TPA: hypothetical protein VHD88_07825 [Pyrinomonadaceae bacterium]|nr:hypothetical protein [Pyrinomonadaceae bacterium]
MNERPVCHRAEDLVTYLYGEASAADAHDFTGHMQQCDACRAEFAIFNQVHESIVLWRNEALGAAFSPAAQPTLVGMPSVSDAAQSVQRERKLSAVAALREFFRVSPLWLRGATAFASLLLCALALLAVSRMGQRPVQVANKGEEPKVYTVTDFKNAVAKEVENQTNRRKNAYNSSQAQTEVGVKSVQQRTPTRSEVAVYREPGRSRTKGLTRQEREQLAADLRLIPGKDEVDLPFVFSDEPNR